MENIIRKDEKKLGMEVRGWKWVKKIEGKIRFRNGIRYLEECRIYDGRWSMGWWYNIFMEMVDEKRKKKIYSWINNCEGNYWMGKDFERIFYINVI